MFVFVLMVMAMFGATLAPTTFMMVVMMRHTILLGFGGIKLHCIEIE